MGSSGQLKKQAYNFEYNFACFIMPAGRWLLFFGKESAVANRAHFSHFIWYFRCIVYGGTANVPDEPNHFLRAYEISQGKLLAKANEDPAQSGMQAVGDILPGNLLPNELKNATNQKYQSIYAAADEKLNKAKPQYYGFSNTALYSPTSYLPQAIGIKAADLFTDNVLGIAYTGRIANWLFIGFLLYCAIKLLPFGKNILFLITFMPVMMQENISLSPDGQAFALVSLLAALVLHIRYSKRKLMTKKEIAAIYLVIILICLCKVVYVPACLLLFLIPRQKFGISKRYWSHIISAILCIVIFSLGWLMITTRYFVEFQPGVSIPGQLKYIFGSPFSYIEVVLHTMHKFGTEILLGAFGKQLGWLNIEISIFLFFIYLVLILLVVLFDNDICHIKNYQSVRIFSGAAAVIIAGAIITTLYLQWNAVGASCILGIQGRYFIPILLMVFLAIKPRGIGCLKTFKLTIADIYYCSLVVNFCVFLTVFAAAL